jgi:hypothetical protein
MTTPTIRLSALTLVVLGLAACAATDDDSCITERKLGANKLSANILAANKLAANKLGLNGLLSEALPEVPLTSSTIAEALDPEALEDEFVQDVLEYMVSCALAPGQSVEVAVDGEVIVYEGSLALAPQWGEEHGECDAECQGWVSACLIARTNFLGESVQISLLGDHPGLQPTSEESLDFDIEEATYFGDLFGESRTLYACVPAGSSGPERTCGDDPSSCAIAVLGECDTICEASGCRDPEGVLHAQTITVNTRDPSAACE